MQLTGNPSDAPLTLPAATGEGESGATKRLSEVFLSQVELMKSHLALLQPRASSPPGFDSGASDSDSQKVISDVPAAPFPLTDAQRELWALSQLSTLASCALNESFVLQIAGPLDVPRFVNATERVVARHAAFRIRFLQDGLEQKLADSANFNVHLALDDNTDDVVKREARKPFDLASGPTIRATLVRHGAGRHDLIVYAHHLVMDGWSSGTLIRQICREYSLGAPESGRVMTYTTETAYVSWLMSELQQSDSDGLAENWQYWMSEHAGRSAPALDLPWDRDRPSEMTFQGNTLTRQLGCAVTERLKGWARQRGLTPYPVLLAATVRVLAELSNQEEVVLLLPAAGQAADGRDMVGYCVQTLPVRLGRTSGETLEQAARSAAAKVRAGFAHAGITISELAARCGWSRDGTRVSPVDVMFNYSAYAPELRMEDCSVIVKENPRSAVVYDLFFNFTEGAAGLELQLSYRQSLADPTTIDGWLTYLLGAVEASLDDPQAPIALAGRAL